MPTIKNPITISEHFNLDSKLLTQHGVLNSTLAVDTRLFIDPFLLSTSKQPEMKNAAITYRKRFENIIKLLSASSNKGDAPWRSAVRLMKFHEISATCLGYGKAGVSGSGFGVALISQIAETSKEIVDLGIIDPDIFALLAIFEEGIGADLISDMTTTVILHSTRQKIQ